MKHVVRTYLETKMHTNKVCFSKFWCLTECNRIKNVTEYTGRLHSSFFLHQRFHFITKPWIKRKNIVISPHPLKLDKTYVPTYKTHNISQKRLVHLPQRTVTSCNYSIVVIFLENLIWETKIKTNFQLFPKIPNSDFDTIILTVTFVWHLTVCNDVL